MSFYFLFSAIVFVFRALVKPLDGAMYLNPVEGCRDEEIQQNKMPDDGGATHLYSQSLN